MDRNYGIDTSIIDEPTIVAEAMLQQEIITKIEKYEPRVLVKTIDITTDNDGSMSAIIEVERNSDYQQSEIVDNSTAEDGFYYDDVDYDADEVD